MMRFWLKDEVDSDFVSMDVEICPISDRSYVDTNKDFLDPAVEDPSELFAEMIEQVTVERYRIDRGFRTDGIYDYKGAVLLAITHEQLYVFPTEEPTHIERMIWQEISIRALSVEVLRTIYSQFRQGFLKPRENWEANAKFVGPIKNFEIKDSKTDTSTPTSTKNSGYGWDY